MHDALRRAIPPWLRMAKVRLFSALPGAIGVRNRLRHRFLTRQDPAPLFETALQACAGMPAIDLGANHGTFTRRLAGSASTVYAFEPDPDTVAALRANTADLPNVEVRPVAAGAQQDTVTLYRRPADEVGAQVASEASTIMGPRDHHISVQDSGVQVEVIDFPAFLTDLGTRVGILKIDIEGAEVALLQRLLDTGAILRCRYIFVETHERLYPEQAPAVDALIRATRPAALRRRFADASVVPTVSLDWY